MNSQSIGYRRKAAELGQQCEAEVTHEIQAKLLREALSWIRLAEEVELRAANNAISTGS